MMLKRTLLVSILVMAGLPSGAAAQQVRGRIVDERSRQPIRSVTVTLRDSADTVLRDAETDRNGFFTLRAPAAGSWMVVVQHPGYAERRRSVAIADGETLVPAFVLRSEAIPLDSLAAEASRRETSREGGFQRASHILAGDRLARLESHGAALITIAREFNGLRTREYKDAQGRNRTCIESVRRVAAMGGPMESGATTLGSPPAGIPCTWIVIVLDDIVIDDPETSLRGMNLTHFESVEYLPPVDAGFRYGMEASSAGALVLWTRGRGPHVDESRNRD